MNQFVSDRPIPNPAEDPDTPSLWQQGATLTLAIEDLNDAGDGVGRWEDRVVFVPGTVPGDRAVVRLVRVKPRYGQGQLEQLLEPASDRIRPACIVADKCGGCQWQHVSYGAQLLAKQQQVEQALSRIGGFTAPPVLPIAAAPTPLGYRNKATYPVAPGNKPPQIRAGYYRQGSHRIVNLNQCPIQDPRLDPILAQVKRDIEARGWVPYREEKHRGLVRHVALRIGHHTGEVLLTLVARQAEGLPGVAEQARQWRDRFPAIVGVCLNINPRRTNVIFGDHTECLSGQGFLTEQLDGLAFQIRPDTFFQVNTAQAETAIAILRHELQLTGSETLVDAYCGVGTLTLPLARSLTADVGRAIGIELQGAAITQARANAAANGLGDRVEFWPGKVEDQLPELLEAGIAPDVVLLDPPRRGCQPAVLAALRAIAPPRIAYTSCKPATLARDLQLLCAEGTYRLTHVQPLDFFPQTPHVEAIAFLERA